MDPRRIWVWSAWLALLGMGIPWGCSRTGLLTAEPCKLEGETRPCANRCGSDGLQICVDGGWQACVVAPQRVACSNACGQGIANCVDNLVGQCDVPDPPPAACTTGCGPGQKICRVGAWGACEYVAGPRSCTNDCSRVDGDGSQSCVHNSSWGPCVVAHREDPCFSACGAGKETCDNNTRAACDAPQPLAPRLHAIIRDFTPETNSDFERASIGSSYDDRKVLLPDLGADGLPVFALAGPSLTISGPKSFNTWYRDTPGVNLTTTKDLQLVVSPSVPGLFVYDNTSFFPIDGELFGNYPGYAHNFHFTLMVATEFVYVGGETFSFSGDDDMWVFINRRLAIDLGGVHESETANIDLDEQASTLQITPGNRYSLHFFFAERHTIESNFTIRTSIADVGACP